MKLVVVESPNKCAKIEKYLGGEYVVRATYGHFRDLAEGQAGVDLATLTPNYAVTEKGAAALAKIKAEVARAEEVLLATDADREGEAISWHLAQVLRLRSPKRVRFVEITEKALRAAVANAGPIDQHLVDAQQARRVLDWVVGFQVSPLLGPGHSAGRVQTATLHLVCERERTIRAFVVKPYWTLTASYGNGLSAAHAVLTEQGKLEEVRFDTEVAAQAVVARAQGPHRVKEFKTEPVAKKPKPAFTTSSLLQAASVALGAKPDATMALAQRLFEGGFITYHRTDSTALSADAVAMARAFLAADNPEALPETAPRYAAKADAQGAHEAIRPTLLEKEPEGLSAQEAALYALIRKRFIACQCRPAVLERTTVTIESGDTHWRAVGSVVKFPSFLRYLSEDEDSEEKDESAEPRLPALAQGEMLQLSAIKVNARKTAPPARYTQASLTKEMERVGIGRPSTYASTLKKLLEDRGYLLEEKKYVLPSEKGMAIDAVLAAGFVDLVEAQYTAAMESRLDDVAEGRRRWQDELRSWYGPFSAQLRVATPKLASLIRATPVLAEGLPKQTDKPCPLCAAVLVEKAYEGRKYLRCSMSTTCHFAGPLAFTRYEKPCPTCGGVTILSTMERGPWVRCTGKDCKTGFDPSAKPYEKPCPKCAGPMEVVTNERGPWARCMDRSCKTGLDPSAQPFDTPCPLCEGPMVVKTWEGRKYARCIKPKDVCKGAVDLSPNSNETCPVCSAPMKDRGDWLSCSRYPECKGSVDKKALAKARKSGRTCPKCSEGLLLERKGGRSGRFLACNRYPVCKHAVDMPEKKKKGAA